MSDTTACGTCKAPSTYAGTQDGIRIYVCTINPKHITQVRRV